MPDKMRAAVLHRPDSISVETVALPEPGSDEVLVKVRCVGICGSDLHYYHRGRIGRYVVNEPMILGHELAGDVVQTGKNVETVQIGDRVAVEPGIPCDRCEYCKTGRYNLCPEVNFMATPPTNGAWAEYVSIRSDFVHPLPENVGYEAGALLEPLSVGVHAMRRARVSFGNTVLISGLGPVGVLAGVAARMFGATKVIGSDLILSRRQKAEELGVDVTVDPSESSFYTQIDKLTNGRGVDVVLETSGAKKSVADTIRCVRRGGTIAFVGLPVAADIPVDIPAFVDKELDAVGVFRYANTYPQAITALAQMQIEIEKIVTHRFPLSQIAEACEVSMTDREHVLKTMIYPNGV